MLEAQDFFIPRIGKGMAYELGFTDPDYFSKLFKKNTGKVLTQFVRKHSRFVRQFKVIVISLDFTLPKTDFCCPNRTIQKMKNSSIEYRSKTNASVLKPLTIRHNLGISFTSVAEIKRKD